MSSLGNDLASIRKELGLSIADIHQTTKIPLEILEAIEDDSIFDTMEENKTYIRSYVRGYAKALKIEDSLIVRALNQIEESGYKGILLDDSGKGKQGPKFQYDAPDEKPENEDSLQESSREGRDMIHDHSPEFSSASASEKSSSGPIKSTPNTVTDPPSVQSVDWADLGRKFNPIEARPRLWLGLIVLLIILVSILLFFWYQQGGSEGLSEQSSPANTETTREAVSSDSLQLNLSNPSAETTASREASSTEPAETLPDTLRLGVYAAYDKLEPVRIQSDVMDSLNPYWIEQGTVLEFPFINEIELRGQYSRMVLLLNGHVIEDFRDQFYNPEIGRVVINRSEFEDDPGWLQPPPDSLGPGIPRPETIQERPTYNN